MSPSSTSYYPTSGAYQTHAIYHPNLAISTASPTFTTLIPNSPNNRRSPQMILSPQLAVSPLHSMTVLNLPNQSRRNSPSPVVSTVVLTTTLSVDPLVAIGTDLYSSKVHYDVSKDPSAAYISTCRINSPISPEQKNFMVVEGAPQGTEFRIVFDHPLLINTVVCDSFLTIQDLIQLLHMHFHQNLGSREKSNLELDVDSYPMAIKNQQKRCQASSDHQKEWRDGMKRIDVLGKECKFRGVELDPMFTHNNLTLRVMFGK